MELLTSCNSCLTSSTSEAWQICHICSTKKRKEKTICESQSPRRAQNCVIEIARQAVDLLEAEELPAGKPAVRPIVGAAWVPGCRSRGGRLTETVNLPYENFLLWLAQLSGALGDNYLHLTWTWPGSFLHFWLSFIYFSPPTTESIRRTVSPVAYHRVHIARREAPSPLSRRPIVCQLPNPFGRLAACAKKQAWKVFWVFVSMWD